MADEGQSQSEQTTVTAEDLAKQLDDLKKTNARLLEESKKYKERAKTIESEVERATEEAMSKEKDVSKLLEAERKRSEKLANDNKSMKQKTLQANIRQSAAKFATDVVDLEDLLNQPKYAEILKRGIDAESLTVDDEVMKEYVEAVLKEKPHFRKQSEATTVMTKKPGYDPKTGNVKPLSQMEPKEIEETLFRLYGNNQ